MNAIVVLVISNPADPELSMLEPLRAKNTIVIGNSPEAFDQWTAEARVLLLWSGTRAQLREVFLRCSKLEWVHSRWAGLDSTLFPELIESPIPLTNGSGVFSPSLGEFALGAMLYFAKDFRRLIRNQMAGLWEEFDVFMVAGQTVGIIGYGDIGREVAKRANAMGMRILALKRHVNSATADPVVEQFFTPDQRLFVIPQCDYVVVCAPLTPETRGMIGEAEIAAMKPDAVIINIGRGPVIQEKALIPALEQGRIKGAALDVFEQEPLPAGHPLFGLENVLLSPHSADHTADWKEQAMHFFLAQMERFQKKQPLENLVNKQLGY